MPTRVEEIAAQRAALPPERLLPAFKLDDATREKYRNQPIRRGTAFTKAEQLNLGEAVHTPAEIQARASN